jgi:hypothetical protein
MSTDIVQACWDAMIAMGKQGANHDVNHPLRAAWEACREALNGHEQGRMPDGVCNYIEGMSVSMDVSADEATAGHRYYGTVTEVMWDREDKNGATLLVQDAAKNF